ncbi:hypothetical protein [Arenimonas sp. MALMAid1274]|uniref:hypothetical protein n=1 Tax=Arenimonas sp. MALMAid1274 TaxID=3411630 RepID=UPI003B9F60A2
MSRNALFLALLATGLAATAQASDSFRSPPTSESKAAGRLAAARADRLEKAGGAAVAAAPTVAEVGDADSFGKNLKWIGLVSSFIQLSPDCTPPVGEPGDPNCVTLAPAGTTTVINAPNLASITLPGRSSQTLLCHWQTPIVQYNVGNFTGAPGNYQFRVTPTYRIESDVLDDPALINPVTGAAFGGYIDTALTAINESGSIGSGESFFRTETGTRMCIGAIVSKASLMNQYGLTEQQAKRFFRRPITITVGLTGTARLVEFANINFGTRFVGDGD